MFLKTILLLVPATTIILAAARAEDPSCPPDWVDATAVGMGCLLANRDVQLTWLETQSYCQTQHLSESLSILTQEEMDFVSDLLDSLWHYERGNYWWTGATDLGREGSWYWAASLTTVGDFIWQQGWPKNTTGNNCAALYYAYGAIDVNCDFADGKYYPICQKRFNS